MEMFRNIGSKIGEDSFVRGSNSVGGAQIMTTNQALDEKKALMRDPAWVTRYLAGGREETAKMVALNTILTPRA
jgi:hypothetical protein